MSTKPAICIWADLTLADVRDLTKARSPLEIKSWLCNKFCFSSENQSMKEKILIDLYFYAIIFGKEHNFNEEQSSAFFSFVKKTHEKAIETSFGNLEETFSFFKELMSCHSAKRPPFCVHLFDMNELKLIQSYMLKTYFRHFKLYKYAFTPKIIMNVSIGYQGVIEEEIKEDETVNPEILVGEEEKEPTEDEIAAAEETIEEEDPPAVKELKNIIESTLEDQINKLKLSVDQKLKANEENILKTVSAGGSNPSPPKSARKGKKK